MATGEGGGKRAAQVAAVLRPIGRGPLSRAQAMLAGRLLGVHWTTVYRLRRRFVGPGYKRDLAKVTRTQDGRSQVGRGSRGTWHATASLLEQFVSSVPNEIAMHAKSKPAYYPMGARVPL
jgi:hypothetical protein